MSFMIDESIEQYELDPEKPNIKAIKRAAELIKSGGIVVYPTDTLYGLGVDPKNSVAMNQLYQIKKRDQNKPVSLLINDLKQAEAIVGELDPEEKRIFNLFFPGKITLLFRVKMKHDLRMFAKQKKIGFRIPKSQICNQLVKQTGFAISTTSVNKSEERNLNTSQEIISLFRDEIDLILDVGALKTSKGSSVLDTTTSPPTLIREGDVLRAEIEKLLGYEIYSKYPEKFIVTFICTGNICRSPMAAGILRHILLKTKYKDVIDINSAGLLDMGQSLANLDSVDVALEHDIDISDHISRKVDANILRKANLVICMALNHYHYLNKMFPDFRSKIVLLKQWTVAYKLTNPSIADPIGQNYDYHKMIFKEINDELNRVLLPIINKIEQFVQDFQINK